MLRGRIHFPISVMAGFASRSLGFVDLVAKFISKLSDYIIVGTLDSINRKGSTLVHIPTMRSFGESAEEIYFGLLKARREGKKIVFPCPWRLSANFPNIVANRELIKIESEYCRLSNNGVLQYLIDLAFTVVLSVLRVLYVAWRANKRILRLLRPHHRSQITRSERYLGVRRVYPEFNVGRANLWKPDGINYFSWDVVQAYDWKAQFDEPLSVGLAPGKQRRAELQRLRMGIPLEDWFVALHSREERLYQGIYLEKSNFFNASILSYIKAIRSITEAGGWVVRIGDPTMTPLPPMERVIDYPFTPFKSELMDLYLLNECRFFVGMASGPHMVARLFRKPEIKVNLADWSVSFPMHKGDLCIIKHTFSRSRNRFLSLQEMLEVAFYESPILYGVGEDYVLVENTSDEICDVVEEFLGQPEDFKFSELQKEFNRNRALQIRRALDHEPLPGSPLLDVTDKYSHATLADSIEGTVGQKYLEENWLTDSLGERRVITSES